MIHHSQDADTWTVTIDRPDKAGALTREMLTELADIATAAQSAKLFILTGTGPVFSAGADLDAARAGLDARRTGIVPDGLLAGARPDASGGLHRRLLGATRHGPKRGVTGTRRKVPP